MSIILNGNTIAGHTPPQSYRFVGEIFQSAIPINDTKVALLDGHRITSSEGYGQFIQYITSVSFIYPQLACTEEEWQNTVTAYGECGKFVIGDSYVRLPKIVSFVQGLSSLNDLANIVEAGLPNIEGSAVALLRQQTQGGNPATSGAFSWADKYEKTATSDSGAGKGYWSESRLLLDASKPNPIYGNSNTVQPQAIQYPYYIVLATGVTQNIQVIEEIECNIPHSLGESKYSPITLNNLSWLKSEGQWNPASIHSSFYDWLLREYNNPDVLAKFNKDAFTVVGSPTITEDGVASGFRVNNYIKKQFSLNSINFKIEGSFTFGEDLTSFQNALNIYSSTYGNYLISLRPVSYNKLAVCFRNSTGGVSIVFYSLSEVPRVTGKKYSFVIEVNGNIAKITINNITKSSSDFVFSEITDLYFGVDSSGNSPFAGSIDLKQFSITVDGVKTFSGANSSVKLVTETYDDYDFVLNTTDKTFRLPLLDGSEDLPSEKYDSLTLLSSQSPYTATANGWFNLEKVITSGGQGINITNTTSNQAVQSSAHASGNSVVCEMFAKKGDVIKIGYDAGGTTVFFRFIYAKGNGSLYYYVGETVQNANLINAGRIEEKVADFIPHNRTVWDGQWVYPSRDSTYISWTTAGTKIIDLSEILPNDGYNYECLFNASFYTNGTTVQLYIGTDLCPLDTSTPNWVYEQGAGKGNSGTIILAVGTGRQVKVNASAAPSGGTLHFRVVGYRRLGTNI